MNPKLVNKLNPVVKNGMNFLMAKRPEILAGGAIVGLAATVYLSGKAGVQLHELKADYNAFLMSGTAQENLEREKKLYIKDAAKIIVKPAIVTAFTGACIIGGAAIAHNQYGALMAAYMMSNDKLKAFETKATKMLGESSTNEIKAEIAQERVLANPITSTSGMVIDTGCGTTLCYDSLSGRYFKSSIEHIRRAQNDTNEEIIADWSVNLNTFYDFLGLNPIKLGENLGWNTNNILRLSFDSALTPSGEPVLVLDYEVYPEYCLL